MEEESISSSPTSTTFYGNNYDYCSHHYNQKQAPAPAPAPASSAPAAASASDFEDADSGWTTYFLQLASDEEEDVDISVPASASRQQLLRDVDAAPCGTGTGRGSVSRVFKPNEAKDNKQAVKKVLKKGVKNTKDIKVPYLLGTTRIIEEEEEDPLQDTASSPLVELNTNGEETRSMNTMMERTSEIAGMHEVWSTPALQRV